MSKINYATSLPSNCMRCGKEFDGEVEDIAYVIPTLGIFCKSCRDKIKEFAKGGEE